MKTNGNFRKYFYFKYFSKKVKNSIVLTIVDFGFEIDMATQIARNKFDIFEYGISYFARTVDEGK